MAIHIALHHRTQYCYDRRVSLGPQTVRLRPAPHSRTKILSYSLRVEPEKHFVNWMQDPQANYLARLVFPDPTEILTLEVDLVAEMTVYNPFDFFLEPQAETFPFCYDSALDHELEPFRRKGPLTPHFKSFLNDLRREYFIEPHAEIRDPAVAGVPHSEQAQDVHLHGILPVAHELHPHPVAGTGVRTIDALVAINQKLWHDIHYLIRMEPGVQTPEETLSKKSGSCRDSAWLLCQLLRHCGLAARFVSGYLIQLKPDVKPVSGPAGADHDFTDLHAWCEVYLPGAGWVGLDPTSGLLAGEGHIPLAATPDPQSAAPITGLVDDCETEFHHEMKVSRVFETPRVTKPYPEQEWIEIERAGHQLDEELQKMKCHLTMGGEPTFVSSTDRDEAEWNTQALGPTKRRKADELMRRLKKRFTHGAFLHYGQGKWYPGESLPRWAFACYWRKDGEPIWENEALFAEENKDYKMGPRQAEEWIHAFSKRLGCGNRWILPAFEDTWHHLWKERRLPVNVDPFDSKLNNAEDRIRLAKIFEQGLDQVVGYVLPLERKKQPSGPLWLSGPWFFRSKRCYLIPGDSPMGYRLPLDSLPWVIPKDHPFVIEQDPMEDRNPLPPHPDKDRRKNFPADGMNNQPDPVPIIHLRNGEHIQHQRPPLPLLPPEFDKEPAPGESADSIVRTALCVQPRDGKLHIFMPPSRTLEDYLEMIYAVEETSELLDTPVVIEGYAPPYDPRIHALKVTPDPGVIEVNIHPSASWSEMVSRTTVLYEEARLTGLVTEKFMIDGRHTGTGGGNHIVLGGTTPKESPLLLRPDLLRSLITYWQNHPSLSFLFSGLFIGPTSQSPRIDEARNDSLYELEIAFRQFPEHQPCPPWLVDRLLRNLLMDSTGNTHRTEFCIDKLYASISASDRLGLLEMRAFEMPPHERMSLAQQLLLRTLVARFWKKPYRQSLVRWGTQIHDRWMLPHFIWHDFSEVISELRMEGYPLKRDWFAPHFEFRFPPIGSLELNHMQLELRSALEPWHVLGEESGAGGTIRIVDASVERLQVKVLGLTNSRHELCVNGIKIPLHPTGTTSESIAGVRYRAWQPESCLHPTIGIHSPLVFDLFDRWNQRSIGGCTYHVSHPGGRSYDTFPVNSYEAESRRQSRFFPMGHTPGKFTPVSVDRNADFPFTLDLRTT